MNIRVFLFISIVLLIFAAPGYAGLFGDEEIEWSQVPANVQQTIQEHAQGGEIEKIETETDNNLKIYEATVKKPDGTEVEIKVNENGTLIEFDTD
jgi:hypothetical protein